MPNYIDETGINITSITEVLTSLKENLKIIYGSDINLDSNTPDGQLINIFAQAIQDLKEFMISIYNDFDPDSAVGTALDARVALNLITRNSGSYSRTPITITTDRAITLTGLDGIEVPTVDIFTVQDNAGNQFYLEDTTVISSSGDTVCNFRAVEMGAVQITQNTITTPVSILLGVTGINNPTVYLTLGTPEETDAQLRWRREHSTEINSIGFFPTMRAALLNVTEVTDVKVFENTTNITDSNGVPAHSYWIIVKGGAEEDIAEVIYQKKSGGSGLKGSTSVNVTQVDGEIFEVNFDKAVAESLYIDFKIESLADGTTIDFDYIKAQMVENISFSINETANKSKIEAFIYDLYTNVYIQDLQVSADDMTYYDILNPSAKKNYFSLDVANINIDYV